MPKFKSKQIDCDAEKVSDLCQQVTRDWNQLPEWVRKAYDKGKILFANDHLIADTGAASTPGNWNDWLVQKNDTLYVFSADKIATEYEAV